MRTGNAARYITLPICTAFLVSCGPAARRPAPAPRPPAEAADRAAPADAGPAAVGAVERGERGADESLSDGLGQSPATAIQVCRPLGQVAYLRRLRCAGERAPAFGRVGQRGYRNPRRGDDDYERSAEQVRTWRPLAADERDLHPVDAYAVTCGDRELHLYLDMYHCGDAGQSVEAPPGFTLAPEPASELAPADDAPADDAPTGDAPVTEK